MTVYNALYRCPSIMHTHKHTHTHKLSLSHTLNPFPPCTSALTFLALLLSPPITNTFRLKYSLALVCVLARANAQVKDASAASPDDVVAFYTSRGIEQSVRDCVVYIILYYT
jgi:hypothetical protein